MAQGICFITDEIVEAISIVGVDEAVASPAASSHTITILYEFIMKYVSTLHLRISNLVHELESFFDTLLTWIATALDKLGVGMRVVAKDVERLVTDDGDEVTCIRPKDLLDLCQR